MAAPPSAAAAATPAAAEPAPLVALEVCNIPPSATHSELASIFSQFCPVEEVVTIFKHTHGSGDSGSDAGGCALVLLPASDAGARDSADMAADILNDYPLEGSLLGVQLCDSPADWLRRSLSPQLAAGLAQLLAPRQQQQQQQQQQDGMLPAEGRPWSAASGEASRGFPPSDAGDSSGGGFSPRSAGGAGGASEPGTASGSQGGAVGGQASETSEVVVMSLDPRLTAREIGEFFLQFGEVEECLKPQGKRYAFVQFVDAAGASRAQQAVHGAWVLELNDQGPVQVLPRTRQRPGSSRQTERQGSGSGQQGSGGGSRRQLFVHNLGLSVSPGAVGAHFEQFGDIESVRKLPQWQYAFVTYARPEDAAAAIEQADGVPVPALNPLLGAPIRVQYSVGSAAKKSSSALARGSRGTRGGKAGGGGEAGES